MGAKRYKRLSTAPALKRLMWRHYAEARYLRLRRPLAWVTSGAPVEILRAMGIVALYPENYGALCGAQLKALTLCQTAEAQGYSLDLCSYARTSLGSLFAAEQAPMGGLPRPDLLVCCNNICSTVVKWYEAIAYHLDVPLFVLDTPFLHAESSTAMRQYVLSQLEAFVAWLERNTGRTLDVQRLERVVRCSNRTVKLWAEIRELCRARPSPLNAPDLFVNMAPIVVLRGDPRAVRFYERFKHEVEHRIKERVGAVPEERHRLLWDNIAIWHQLYRFYSLFVDYGACFVADSYTGAWANTMASGSPLEALSQAYTDILLNQSLEHRAHLMLETAEDYAVDGIVMHGNRSCKTYSLGQLALRQRVRERSGLPVLIVDADMCDPRGYSQGVVRTQVQAFVEALEEA